MTTPMKKSRLILVVFVFILLFAGSLWWTLLQNRATDIDNDQVIGSILDPRSPKEIAEDINRSNEEIVRSIRQWLNLGPDNVDLRGWDDATLEQALHDVDAPLDALSSALSQRYGKISRISKRVKSLESLIAKLQEKNQLKPPYTLRDVQDLAGLRLVFHRLDQLKTAVIEIENQYDIINTQDYITNPKESGYRAIHEVIYFHSVPVEVQIRSESMDLWSEWHHGSLYKNRQKVEEAIGAKKLTEFDRYFADMAKYMFSLELGREEVEPTPPQGLEILWELAPPGTREHMLPDGRPDLSGVRHLQRRAA